MLVCLASQPSFVGAIHILPVESTCPHFPLKQVGLALTQFTSLVKRGIDFAQVALGLGSPLGTALDMWSLGCILAELALQQPLFPCHSPAQLIQQVGFCLNFRPSRDQIFIRGGHL